MKTLIRAIKRRRADRKWLDSVKEHRSRLDPKQARVYTEYLHTCQRAFQEPLHLSRPVEKAVIDFKGKGFTSWWDEENGRLAQSMLDKIRQEEAAGQPIWDESSRYREEIYQRFPEIEQLFQKSLGQFLRGVFQSHFKIYYGLLYKSQRDADAPSGSQLWHADGGPGTCIIVMFALKDLTPQDGAMELLPWRYTEEVFSKERPDVPARVEAAAKDNPSLSRLELREIKTEFYRRRIEAYYKGHVEQPVGQAGLVIPFSNNVLHKGGFPEAGRVRYVCVFHVYPSHKATDWERYRTRGIAKRGPFPKDPSSEF